MALLLASLLYSSLAHSHFLLSWFSIVHVLSLLVLVYLWFLFATTFECLETCFFFYSWLLPTKVLEVQVLGYFQNHQNWQT
jgi:hypothetical protein